MEEVFQAAGVLHEFEITAGIPETLPSLLQVLRGYLPSGAGALLEERGSKEQQQQQHVSPAAAAEPVLAAAATA